MRSSSGFLALVTAASLAAGCSFDATGLGAGGDGAPAADQARADARLSFPDARAAEPGPAPDLPSTDGAAPDQLPPDLALPDTDGDGVPDVSDNCPAVKNPGQADLDGDGEGDPCDLDKDGDTLPDAVDPAPLVADKVLFFKLAGPAAGDLYTFGTGWGVQGDALCQSKDDEQNYRTRLKSLGGVKDYVVDARFSVSSTKPTSDWPAAGINLRTSSVGSGNYDAYLCVVDLQFRRLVLARYTDSVWQQFVATGGNTVPASGPYRLRATATGADISCELVGSSLPALKVTNSEHTSGTAGYHTDKAQVCFDYLMVLPAP